MKIKNITILSMLLFVFAVSVSADVWTDSLITGNTTWQKNNSSGDGVYIIDLNTDSLVVADGAVLTIEPGVIVKFHDDIRMVVRGTLIAAGTDIDSIKFIIDDAAGSASEWGGIKLLSEDSTYANQLSYCLVEGADADGTGLSIPTELKNGGGIFFGANIRNTTMVSHCTIRNNHAIEGGGGMAFAGSPLVNACQIYSNSADQYGGGLSLNGPSPSVFANPGIGNSIIRNNTTIGQGGGGVALFSGAVLNMNNCLIANNEAPNGNGGGVYLYSALTIANIINSIIGYNTANIDNEISGVANITYSDIYGGYSGTGNIDEDPQFFDIDNNNFHFGATSPLVDAGSTGDAPVDDFDGNARPFDGDRDGTDDADIGPYEYINTAPEITSVPVTGTTEDQDYSYQAEAVDTDSAEVLTWSLMEAPAFLSINTSTGEITGRATTDAEAGPHTVTVQVADLNNATDTQTYTLTVTAVNDAPVVSGIPDQTINEGETFATVNLDNYVTDEESPDADITWQYSGNTQLSVSIENRVATISIPDTNWYGSETITFIGSDPGGLSGSDAAVFTVNNINDAPVISDIPDQTVDEGGSFVQINLDDYVNDIDNVESDLNWTSSGSSALTVTIDENRVATVSIPDTNWYGSETITFTVKDPGGLEDSDPAKFTVTSVNDAPVVSDIADQTIDEGQTFVTIDLDDYVTDVDNSAAEMTWTYSGNSDLIVSIDPNHTASVVVPDADWFGSEEITFTATDPDGLSDGDAAVFTVNNINDAPVAADDSASTNEDTAATIYVLNNDSDIENDALTVTSVSTAAHGTANIGNDTLVVYTPDENWSGEDSFTYNISDGNGGTASATVTVTVNAVNDAPAVAGIADQTIDEGQTFVTITLDDYVTDVDNSAAEMSWTFSGNSELAVSIDENRVATITTPDVDWFGSEEITFTATDPGGLSDGDAAVFTVTNVNDAPVVSAIAGQTIDEGGSFTVIDLNASVEDVDNSDAEITWTVTGNTELVVSIDENNQATVSTPDTDWNGSETLTFTATDPGSLSDNTSAVFTVNAVNDAPVVSDIADQSISEGQSFAVFDLDTLVADVDDADSTLTWAYTGTTSLSVEISAQHLVTVTAPDANWNGSEEIIFTATDTSGSFDSDAAVFTVNAINDAPVVSAIAGQTIDEGGSFTVIDLNASVEDVDNSDAEISWTVTGNTELVVSINENNQATVSTPDTDWNGSETLTFTASDPGGLNDSTETEFTVNPVNDAPVLDVIAGQTVPEGSAFRPVSLDDFVNDVDDPDSLLQWSVSGNSELMAVIEDRILTVTAPSEDWNGSETLHLFVADTTGLTDSTTVAFTISAVNDSVVFIATLPELSFNEDDSLLYAVSGWYPYADDKDNPDSTLLFTAFSGKQVTAALKTEMYLFKAQPDWFGNDTLLLTVSDGEFSDSAWFHIVVNPINDVPVITNLPGEISMHNDTTITLHMFDYVQDVDTPDSLLSWTFTADEDSLHLAYEQNSGTLSLTAPAYSGTVQLICTVTDDSAAAVSDTVTVVVIDPTGIEDYLADQLPQEYKLNQNYPNPFNPSTTISYQLKAASEVNLEIFNILGQKIATLVNEKQQAGFYNVRWNASAFANGVYFYQIRAGKFIQVRKMILMK